MQIIFRHFRSDIFYVCIFRFCKIRKQNVKLSNFIMIYKAKYLKGFPIYFISLPSAVSPFFFLPFYFMVFGGLFFSLRTLIILKLKLSCNELVKKKKKGTKWTSNLRFSVSFYFTFILHLQTKLDGNLERKTVRR